MSTRISCFAADPLLYDTELTIELFIVFVCVTSS